MSFQRFRLINNHYKKNIEWLNVNKLLLATQKNPL